MQQVVARSTVNTVRNNKKHGDHQYRELSKGKGMLKVAH
jgi:hypothetical protein